jgi:cytochrome c-type biogenesis protein CcmH/NrfG
VLENLEDTKGLFSLGITYASDLGDYDKARVCFDRAVRLRASDAQLWLGKGQALLRLSEGLETSAASENVTKMFE